MLSGELAKFLSDIVSDYNKFKIKQLLIEAINALQGRSANNPNQYIQQAKQIRERAQNIILNNNIRLYPEETKNLLSEGPYTNIHPSRMASIILSSVPEYFISAAASGELQVYSTLIDEAISSFNEYIDVSNKFDQTYKPVPEGFLKIELMIPKDRYDDDLGKLGKKLEQFDRFFAAASNLYGLTNEKPTISVVSTGSFVADLIANADSIKAVLGVYSILLGCASQMIDLYKSARTLRESGIETPELDNRKVAEGLISKAFKQHFDEIAKNSPAEQVNEARIKLQTYSVFMIEEIQNGSRVSLSISSEKERLALTSSEAGAAVEEPQKLLEDLRIKQQDVSRKVAGEAELPRLTGPTKETPD